MFDTAELKKLITSRKIQGISLKKNMLTHQPRFSCLIFSQKKNGHWIVRRVRQSIIFGEINEVEKLHPPNIRQTFDNFTKAQRLLRIPYLRLLHCCM